MHSDISANDKTLFALFRPGRESDSEAEDIEHAEKLRQVKAVLEEVSHLILELILFSFSYLLNLFLFLVIG